MIARVRLFSRAALLGLGLLSREALADTAPGTLREPCEPCGRASTAPESPRRALATLELGLGQRRLLSTWIAGAEGRLSLGANARYGAWHVDLESLRGSTAHSLDAFTLSLGGSWEFRADALRYGLGGRATYLCIARATGGDPMRDAGLGLRAFASYDVVPLGAQAFYLALALTADFMLRGEGDRAALWGPSLSVGYRF